MARRRVRAAAASRPTTGTVSLRPVKRGGLWQLVDAKLQPIRDANRFFAALAIRGLSCATIRAYGYDLVVLYRWLDRVGYAVRDLSGEKLLEYIGSQRAAGAQPTSINRRLTTARLFCRFCVGETSTENGV